MFRTRLNKNPPSLNEGAVRTPRSCGSPRPPLWTSGDANAPRVGSLATGIGKTANATIETEFQLAQLLAALGQEAEARTIIVRVVPLLETRFVETALLRAQVAELQQKLGPG